jgi:hypothetical protein
LERDINKIFLRLDSIENVLVSQNLPISVLPTPSDSAGESPAISAKYEDTVEALGNNPVLYIHKPTNESEPREQDAFKSLSHSFMYSLHKAANVPFPFPSYLRREKENLGLPFLPYPRSDGSLPVLEPEMISR